MGSTAIDSGDFPGIFQHFRVWMRRVWLDENRIQKYLDIEASLARAQAQLGVIPREAAAEIEKHCNAKEFDLAKLKKRTETIGYPVLPVVEQLVGLLRQPLGRVGALGRYDAGHYRHRRRVATMKLSR